MEDGSLFGRMRQIFQIEEEEDGSLQREAARLIRNIVRYLDKDAKDIMTHRRNIQDFRSTGKGSMRSSDLCISGRR